MSVMQCMLPPSTSLTLMTYTSDKWALGSSVIKLIYSIWSLLSAPFGFNVHKVYAANVRDRRQEGDRFEELENMQKRCQNIKPCASRHPIHFWQNKQMPHVFETLHSTATKTFNSLSSKMINQYWRAFAWVFKSGTVCVLKSEQLLICDPVNLYIYTQLL